MQPRILRYFEQVARSSSIRDAAEKLFVTPTAVTRQVELLEHEYGAKLIERGPKGIKLTPEGSYVAQAVQTALRELNAAKERISSEQGIITGTVRILAGESLAPLFLIPVMASFRQRHPQVSFELEFANASQTMEGLLLDRADIALTFYMPTNADVEITHSCSLPHTVIMAENHVLATKTTITLQELEPYPLAIPQSNFSIRQSLEAAARRESLTLDIRFVTSSLTAQKQLAAMGQSLSILPQTNLEPRRHEHGIVSVPLDDKTLGRVKVDMCLPRQRNISIATRLFHDVLAARIEEERFSVGY